MTQDEIIRMAREAGFAPSSSYTVLPMKDYASHGILYELERFAALVAAHEREACAKVCEEGTALTAFQSKDCYSYARNRAAAIRARGEK